MEPWTKLCEIIKLVTNTTNVENFKITYSSLELTHSLHLYDLCSTYDIPGPQVLFTIRNSSDINNSNNDYMNANESPTLLLNDLFETTEQSVAPIESLVVSPVVPIEQSVESIDNTTKTIVKRGLPENNEGDENNKSCDPPLKQRKVEDLSHFLDVQLASITDTEQQ